MINFSLHVRGPKLRVLLALANGEYRSNGGSLVVSGLERDGLAQFRTIKSAIEGVTVSEPVITERGLMVVDLLRSDVKQYLSGLKGKRTT